MPRIFANVANIAIDESAANTLTFKELTSGAGLFEKMAMIIYRIEYQPSAASLALILGNADHLSCAWTTSDQIAGIAKESAQVIDRCQVTCQVIGTPASFVLTELPITHDFANLPGGGIIVPATNLYVACLGASLASATYWRSTLYFEYIQLKDSEYWELVQATRALS